MGEGEKRRQAREMFVITNQDDMVVGNGSTGTFYLTRGMAEAALERMEQRFPGAELKLSTWVPQSTKLVFMDVGE